MLLFLIFLVIYRINMSLKLYFFGDSICVGQYVSVHKTWVSKISQKLEDDLKNKVIAINASVNGNTTRMALERMHYDVLSHKPDILFIQFGMNDCNIWATDKGCERVSVDAYFMNIKEMILKARSAGVKKIIINTNHSSSLSKSLLPGTNVSYEENNFVYYGKLKKLKKLNFDEILLIDVREHLENKKILPSQFLLKDGVHLNEFGHCLYFEYVYPHVKEAIKRIM